MTLVEKRLQLQDTIDGVAEMNYKGANIALVKVQLDWDRYTTYGVTKDDIPKILEFPQDIQDKTR